MNETLEAQIGRLLNERGLTIALAESCTGGLVAHRLTNIAGSSDYVRGGVVSYANEAKEQLLGVSHETLLKHGAVSQETALEMARGARKLFATDIAMSVTGIAGPGGGTEGKPVGLTFVGLAAEGYETVERYVWQSDRVGNKHASADAALRLVLRYLGVDVVNRDQLSVSSGEVETTVEADIRSDGTVRPRTFTWDGRTQRVAGIGRQWIEGQQRHVLVMSDARETFELSVAMPQMRWMVKAVGSHPMVA